MLNTLTAHLFLTTLNPTSHDPRRNPIELKTTSKSSSLKPYDYLFLFAFEEIGVRLGARLLDDAYHVLRLRLVVCPLAKSLIDGGLRRGALAGIP